MRVGPLNLTRWSPITKRVVIVGLVVVALVGVWLFRSLLPPILLAVVLAYLLKPLVDFLERRTRLSRLMAVLLVFLALFGVIATIPFTVVPYLVGQVSRLTDQLQGIIREFASFLSRPIVILNFRIRPQDLVGDVPATLQGLFQPFATQTVSLLLGIASSLLWVLAISIIAFYLVKDAARLRTFLDRITPPGYREELACLREEINRVWTHFFRGQVVLCVIIGLAVFVAMAVVGFPNAGLMGLIAGLLEVIPNFGPVLATIPALLIAFFQGSTYLPLSPFWFAVLVLGIYTLIQQAENAYLVPRVMGRRMRLHPVIVFVGVLGGGYLAGALGVFLAAPILGTLRVLVRYVYAKLLDEDPFPLQPEPVRKAPHPNDIDAIFLDLDGTLIETDDEAVASLAHRLQPLRRILPGHAPERAARRLLMALEGPAAGLLGMLDRVGLDNHLLGMGDGLRRLRGLPDVHRFRALDGVAETLLELSKHYPLAIVTTRSQHEAGAFLAQHGLANVITSVTGRENTWRIKPHPSPVRYTAQLLGIPVERCLMVGDTVADIRAARAAGTYSVGVLCGFGSQEELEHAGADLILETTNGLVDWMRGA